MQTGRGQVFDESSRELNYARLVTELSKPRSGKGTHTDSGVSVRLSSELLENRVRNKLLIKK